MLTILVAQEAAGTADDKGGITEDGSPEVDAAFIDRARVKALDLRFRDWSETRNVLSHRGLTATATLFPDALAAKIVSTYLQLRSTGKETHESALSKVASRLARWKRYAGSSLVELRLENKKYRFSPRRADEFRIFTLQKNLAKEGLLVTDGRGRRVPVRLAGKPANLRLAQLQVKKFWKSADGETRRSTPRDRAVSDPASVGRKPMLSKPVATLVIEGEPVELEVLVKQKAVEKSGLAPLRVRLTNWKRYEGPFSDDQIDLNRGRPWEDLRDHELEVHVPPAGTRIYPEIETLVQQAHQLAAAATDE